MKRKSGEGRHKFYNKWRNMKARCYRPSNKSYATYGGRGITVHPLWLNNSSLYLSYIESLPNAGKEGYTIDRVDNNSNYEPMNLRWADKHIQNNNKGRYNTSNEFFNVSSFVVNGVTKYKAVLYKVNNGKNKCFTATTAKEADRRRSEWAKAHL